MGGNLTLSAAVSKLSGKTIVLASAALLLLWVPVVPASAETGDVLRVIELPGRGVGAAFDGSHVWFTLGFSFDTRLHRIDPVSEIETTLDMVALTEGRLIVPGALAWDPTRGHLWVAAFSDIDAFPGSFGDGEIFEIDPIAEVVVSSFPTRPFTEADEPLTGVIDGLAYDPSTDTLWFSPDQAVNIPGDNRGYVRVFLRAPLSASTMECRDDIRWQ